MVFLLLSVMDLSPNGRSCTVCELVINAMKCSCSKQQLTSIHSNKNCMNSEQEMFRTQLVQLAIIRLQLCKYCLFL